MDFCFLDPWHAFLPREGGHVISVFGGGGKTSLLSLMAQTLGEEGVPIVVTTTTRTERLEWPRLVVRDWEDLGSLSELGAPLLFVRDGVDTSGKWLGIAPERVDALSENMPRHVCLVEVDGSAGLPVKLHRQDEPIWPRRTSLAIAVIGLSAIARPVSQVLHRHGRLPVPWLAAGDGDRPWSWIDMERLLAGPTGYLKHVPAGVPLVVVLAQMDALNDSIGLFDFAGRVMKRAGVPIVVFAELAGAAPHIRTAIQDRQQADGRSP